LRVERYASPSEIVLIDIPFIKDKALKITAAANLDLS
jgi:hypothetical protein